jgi:hypothetical protein
VHGSDVSAAHTGLTYFVHQLRDVHRVTGRTRNIHHGKRRRPANRVHYVSTVVRRVQRLPVPALREYDVGANAAQARLVGEMVGVVLGVHARRVRTAAPIWRHVAAVALLHVLAQAFGRAPQGVSGEHTEPGLEGLGGVGVG